MHTQAQKIRYESLINTDLIIRQATPNDDDTLGQLLVEAYVKAYARNRPDEVITNQRKNELLNVATRRKIGIVLVAELNGSIVGTVTIFNPGVPESNAWLDNSANIRYLAVDYKLHGQGLSKPLLDEAERIVKKCHIDAICLHVRSGSYGLEQLYKNRGYVPDPMGNLNYPYPLKAYFLRCSYS